VKSPTSISRMHFCSESPCFAARRLARVVMMSFVGVALELLPSKATLRLWKREKHAEQLTAAATPEGTYT